MKKFKDLVKEMYPNSRSKGQTIEILRDFVRGCISLNPNDRPNINEVLQHKIFGGANVFRKKKNDVWIKKSESILCPNKLKLPIILADIFNL